MTTRVTFGTSGMQVSPVSFGTWQLSPRFWGQQSEEEAITAMKTALDLGINFFDTADAYGDGLAETVLGRFVAQVPRDDVIITTKVVHHFNPDSTRYPDLSPENLRVRCDIQLKRLGVDMIDVYLLHSFDPLTPIRVVTETLNELRQAGKIRHFGVSNFNVEQHRAMRTAGAYEVSQPPYSLLDRGIEEDLLPYCESENLGVMVYSPLHKGLLTGKYDGSESFSDFREHHADFKGERFRSICDAVRTLQPLADKYGMSLYQLVLAATLEHPAVQVAIVGIKTAKQIQEAAAVMGQRIERPDYFAVRQALTLAPTRIQDAAGGRR
jgi:aryl-alcohol dehydrogenase-like predicted oxidoreductase